jgi:hypothetical protein
MGKPKGFAGGLAYAGGVITAVVIGLGVIATIFLGCAGLVAWNHYAAHEKEKADAEVQSQLQAEAHERRLKEEQAAAERIRLKQAADAAAHRRKLEEEQRKREAEERREQRLAEERRLVEQAAAAKAQAEAEKLRLEKERRAAEERREKERREQQEEQAREARRRAEQEEMRKPLSLTLDEVYSQGKALRGRVVQFTADGTLKVFAGGRGSLYFSRNGTLIVKVDLDKAEKDAEGSVRVRVQATVNKVVSGVLYLSDGSILGWK